MASMPTYESAALKCVHLALRLGAALLALVRYYRAAVGRLWGKVNGRGPTLTRCREDGKGLGKRPCHLGLLVGEETVSYADLCAVVVWCMALGIPYISLYDWHGNLKKNAAVLKGHLDRIQEEVLGKDKSKFTYQLHRSHSKKHSSNEGAQVHILLLSSSDGRLDLVRTAGDYCHAVANHILKPQDLSPDLVNSMLHSTKGFPDPDLLIRFGPTDSLMGYLPWQIRLTEILSMPTHWRMDYDSVLDKLHEYAGTQQRFGK